MEEKRACFDTSDTVLEVGGMVLDILGTSDFSEMGCKLLVNLAWWQQNQTRRKPKKQETRKQDQTRET